MRTSSRAANRAPRIDEATAIVRAKTLLHAASVSAFWSVAVNAPLKMLPAEPRAVPAPIATNATSRTTNSAHTRKPCRIADSCSSTSAVQAAMKPPAKNADHPEQAGDDQSDLLPNLGESASRPAATAIAPNSTNSPNDASTPATMELHETRSLRAMSAGPRRRSSDISIFLPYSRRRSRITRMITTISPMIPTLLPPDDQARRPVIRAQGSRLSLTGVGRM